MFTTFIRQYLYRQHVAALDILEEFKTVVSIFVLDISHLYIIQRYNALWLAISWIFKVV